MREPMKTLIVGGSRGIGYALAWHFKKIRKDDVCIVARTAEELEESAKRLKVKSFPGDVRASADVVASAAKLLGGLDVVVNTAGVFTAKSDSELLEINVLGALGICTAAAKILPPKSRIILFSGGGVGGPGVGKECSALYAASKAAVVQLTECLAQEHPELRINAIAPGRVATKMRDNVGSSPVGAVQCVDWLCSDEAKDITGRLISASRDGGIWTSRVLGWDWGKLRRVMP